MIGDYLARRKMAKIGRDVGARLDAHPRLQKVDPPVPGHETQIYVYQNFLKPADCEKLIERIDQGAQPSIVYKAANSKGFRTSYSCNLDRFDPDLLHLDERICGLVGLDARQGETLQGQRYQPGQYFKPHHDYFHVDQGYWKLEKPFGGQRTWTAMVFLNEPEEGGETEFPHLGFQMMPRTGMLMIWNNLSLDGRVNPYTLHSGNAVTRGVKYIVTKWFRTGHWVKEI